MTHIDFGAIIASLDQLRDFFNAEKKDFWGEYCYHMKSIMIESEKVLNGAPFSPTYIVEHCNTLSGYAREIAREEHRSHDIF